MLLCTCKACAVTSVMSGLEEVWGSEDLLHKIAYYISLPVLDIIKVLASSHVNIQYKY